MAPAVMVTAAPAPSVMMAAATAAHPMAVTVPTSALDLNHRVILRGRRRDPQPGGSGCGHCQQQRATNQCNASHAVVLSSHRMIAISHTISRPGDCSAGAEMPIISGPITQALPTIPEAARYQTWAKASLGDRATGITLIGGALVILAGGGPMVGGLVSITLGPLMRRMQPGDGPFEPRRGPELRPVAAARCRQRRSVDRGACPPPLYDQTPGSASV
jgi:hypothetical protein